MSSDLISALASLTAPDREVDALIWLEFTPGATRKQWSYIHTATGRECHVDETRDATDRLIIVPELTSSLDATVALCERVLPGWSVIMGWNQTSQTIPWARVGHEFSVDATGRTPAIALLIAILTALETRENG